MKRVLTLTVASALVFAVTANSTPNDVVVKLHVQTAYRTITQDVQSVQACSACSLALNRLLADSTTYANFITNSERQPMSGRSVRGAHAAVFGILSFGSYANDELAASEAITGTTAYAQDIALGTHDWNVAQKDSRAGAVDLGLSTYP